MVVWWGEVSCAEYLTLTHFFLVGPAVYRVPDVTDAPQSHRAVVAVGCRLTEYRVPMDRYLTSSHLR